MRQIFSRIIDMARAGGLALLALAVRVLRYLPGASWQSILVLCLALALLLAVLPAALLLFIVFLMLKLIAVAVLVPAKKDEVLTMPRKFDDKDGQ